eukprot:gene5554-9372_t
MKQRQFYALVVVLLVILTKIGISGALTCFGVDSEDTSVCSGHGTCNETDVCTCDNEYDGYTCEINYKNLEYNIIYGFGHNGNGEIGDNSTSPSYTPKKLPIENHLIQKIYGTDDTFFFVKNYSQGFGVGKNNFGEIGRGNTIDAHVPSKFTENKEIKSLSVGDAHTILLKKKWKCFFNW